MWKLKIRLKHKCLFGDNCSIAKVTCVNISFNAFKKGKDYYVYHFGTVFYDNYFTSGFPEKDVPVLCTNFKY